MAEWDFSDFRTLAADLARASARVEPLAQAVVTKSAADLQRLAQSAAPVDTGFLRSSISTTVGRLEAEVGPTAHYGIYQELGTSRMGPQPYLFPALDQVTPGFEQAIAQVIDQAVS